MHLSRRILGLVASTAGIAIGFSTANAQAVVKPIARNVYVAYGLDALRLRIASVTMGTVPKSRPGGHDRDVDSLPLPTFSHYLNITLTVRNDGRIPENIPLLQTTLRLRDGSDIDPAVYGPFVGDANVEAPTTALIAPRSKLVLHLIAGDIPNDRAVESLVLSPNDATPAYRYRLTP